ncbi:hypothetical protein ACF07Y_22475 [Streptomyces sp. NPDC016566]
MGRAAVSRYVTALVGHVFPESTGPHALAAAVRALVHGLTSATPRRTRSR